MDLSSIKISVLVIDDDHFTAKILSKICGRLDIKDVIVADNGFEGVALALKKKPTVIFCDILMPEINGLQVLKMLKTIDITNRIPVLMITGNPDYAYIKTAMAQGACDFVSKPFSFETIQEKLGKAIKESEDYICEAEFEV